MSGNQGPKRFAKWNNSVTGEEFQFMNVTISSEILSKNRSEMSDYETLKS